MYWWGGTVQCYLHLGMVQNQLQLISTFLVQTIPELICTEGTPGVPSVQINSGIVYNHFLDFIVVQEVVKQFSFVLVQRRSTFCTTGPSEHFIIIFGETEHKAQQIIINCSTSETQLPGEGPWVRH